MSGSTACCWYSCGECELQVLTQLPWLRSLNLRGCPVSERRDYPGTVLALLPDLDTLDSKRRADHPKARVAKAKEARPRSAQDAPNRMDMTETATVSGTSQRPVQAANVRQPKATRQAQGGGGATPQDNNQAKEKAQGAPADPPKARGLRGVTGKMAGKRRADAEAQPPASGGTPQSRPRKMKAAVGSGPGAAEAAAPRSGDEQHLGAERSLPLAVSPGRIGGMDAAAGQDGAEVHAPQPASALVGIYEPKAERRGKKKKQQGSVARGAQVS